MTGAGAATLQSGAGRVASYLAFDYGTRRVGVATGNTLLGRATPLRTVAAEGERRFAAIAQLIDEWRPDALVVGVPFHPDGAAHDNTRRAQRFARQLHGRFKLPVFEVDERYTTTEALAYARDARDACAGGVVADAHPDFHPGIHADCDADADAAALILDQYLRGLPHAEAEATAASHAED